MPFEIVRIRDLPPSVPMSCRVAISNRISGNKVGDVDRLLQALETQACCYSGRDWHVRAKATTQALRAVGGTSGASLVAHIRANNSDPLVVADACDLIEDGINWRRGMKWVSGGEHRLCAMRDQGVSEVVVYLG